MIFLSIAFKLILGFFLLILVTRLMGKKNLSEATPYDFAFTVVLAALLEETVYDEKIKWYQMVFAFAIWTIIGIVLQKVTQKFIKSRPVVKGEPVFLMERGNLNYHGLQKANLEMEQFTQMLRQQGIFSVQEVDFALLEVNGQLSVKKKYDYESLKRGDIPTYEVKKAKCLPTIVIENGRLKEENMKDIHLTEGILMQELKRLGYRDIDNIYFAEWSDEEGLFIAEYPDSHSDPSDKE